MRSFNLVLNALKQMGHDILVLNIMINWQQHFSGDIQETAASTNVLNLRIRLRNVAATEAVAYRSHSSQDINRISQLKIKST